MKLLGVDTSASATVLGLQIDGKVMDASKPDVRQHSRDLLPAIDELLKDAGISLNELDAIVFGQGPGSFTGLRIAAGVVQGLAYGAQLPVAPVSTLATLAHSFVSKGYEGNVLAAIHAREDEVYAGLFSSRQGELSSLAPELVDSVHGLPNQHSEEGDTRWCGIGNAWHMTNEMEASLGVSLSEVVEESVPSIFDLLTLGQRVIEANNTVSAEMAIPVYLREQVAVKSKNR